MHGLSCDAGGFRDVSGTNTFFVKVWQNERARTGNPLPTPQLHSRLEQGVHPAKRIEAQSAEVGVASCFDSHGGHPITVHELLSVVLDWKSSHELSISAAMIDRVSAAR